MGQAPLETWSYRNPDSALRGLSERLRTRIHGEARDTARSFRSEAARLGAASCAAVVAIVGGASMVAAALCMRIRPLSDLYEATSLSPTVVLLVTWAAVLAAWLLARAAAGAEPLLALPSAHADPVVELEQLRAFSAERAVRDGIARRARHACRLRVLAISCIAPLSLHALVYLPLEAIANGGPAAVHGFDAWIALSVRGTWLAHGVLGYQLWRRVTDQERGTASVSKRGTIVLSALGGLVGCVPFASVYSNGCLVLIMPAFVALIVLVTGMVLVAVVWPRARTGPRDRALGLC